MTNIILTTVDLSVSMEDNFTSIGSQLSALKNWLISHPSAANIKISRLDFDDRMGNIATRGFVSPIAFRTEISGRERIKRMTSMYEAIIESKKRLENYLELMRISQVPAKGIFLLISDARNTVDSFRLAEAREAVQWMGDAGIDTVLIGYGGAALRIGAELGFGRVVDGVGDGSAAGLLGVLGGLV